MTTDIAPDTKQQDSTEFLQKYLEHLERKDSREGATKWLLVVALAALTWQLLGMLFSINIKTAIELFSILLACYFVVEVVSDTLDSFENDSSGIRILHRRFLGAGHIKKVFFLAVRFLFTAAAFHFFFQTVSEKYRYAIAFPVGSIALGAIIMLVDAMREYNVKKPNGVGPLGAAIIITLFTAPIIYGLYGLIGEYGLAVKIFDKNNLRNLQASGLMFAIAYVVEKYSHSLTVDAEINAVRKVWRRYGVGEIAADEAKKELRLIIAGASLSEVISIQVSEFSQLIQKQEDLEAILKEELDRLSSLEEELEKDNVILNALKSSMVKHRGEMNAGLSIIETRCESILTRVKKLLGDDHLSSVEAIELKRSLEDHCSQRRAAVKQLVDQITP